MTTPVFVDLPTYLADGGIVSLRVDAIVGVIARGVDSEVLTSTRQPIRVLRSREQVLQAIAQAVDKAKNPSLHLPDVVGERVSFQALKKLVRATYMYWLDRTVTESTIDMQANIWCHDMNVLHTEESYARIALSMLQRLDCATRQGLLGVLAAWCHEFPELRAFNFPECVSRLPEYADLADERDLVEM